ncbi:MAG: hypothetical protein ACOCZ6_03120 [Nanoarchaeota archaeon]
MLRRSFFSKNGTLSFNTEKFQQVCKITINDNYDNYDNYDFMSEKKVEEDFVTKNSRIMHYNAIKL